MNRRSLPKYCSWNRDRKGGKARVRFRKGRIDRYLTGTPYSDEFMRQYHEALSDTPPPIGAERARPGTISALIMAYYRSAQFKNLSPVSQKNYRGILERFRRKKGNKPVARLERRHVAQMMGEMAVTPSAANTFLKRLRTLMRFAIEIGLRNDDPTRYIKPYKIRSGGYHTWSEDEIEAYVQRHPRGGKAHLAFALLLYTGSRRSDVVRLGHQHIDGDYLRVHQQKSGTVIDIPLHAELKAALRAIHRTDLTFLVTEYGHPFTANGFGNWFRKRCDEAGLPQCSAHGLRKAAARRLAEAGCTDRQIMAITGHRSAQEVSRYVNEADQRRLADDAMTALERTKPEQKLSSKPESWTKSPSKSLK